MSSHTIHFLEDPTEKPKVHVSPVKDRDGILLQVHFVKNQVDISLHGSREQLCDLGRRIQEAADRSLQTEANRAS